MSSLLSEKKKQENIKLADDAYKQAKKKAGTTLTRWKPDWEQAARFYRDAVKYYRLGGDMRMTVQCCRESAIAHEEIQSYHTAGQDLELAAQLSASELLQTKEAAELYTESARMYRTNGSHDKAAGMLVKAAECYGSKDVDSGVTAMKDACTIFEEEGRGAFHEATFKKAIQYCVQQKRYDDAIEIINRQNVIYRGLMDTFERDLYKNYLTIIVLRFQTEDYKTAAEELAQFENMERFGSSDECVSAGELLEAYENGSNDDLSAALKKPPFKYLLNVIAQLARKLEFNKDIVRRGEARAAAKKAKAQTAKQNRNNNTSPKAAKKKAAPESEEEEEEPEEEEEGNDDDLR